jgi:hypothetical protein
MNEQIRELAEQAGGEFYTGFFGSPNSINFKESDLEKFAELIAAEERNRTWTQSHWTEYERKIVAAEREACAKVCEYLDSEYEGEDVLGTWCAAAIRARGNE